MPPTGVPKPRILVAEDNAINRVIVSRMLELEGYSFDVVEDGFACVAALHMTSYDLVLMDISMPGMDGVEATRTIRSQQQGNPLIPIIAVTANAGPQENEEFFAAGMNAVLEKPFSRTALRAVLEKWL